MKGFTIGLLFIAVLISNNTCYSIFDSVRYLSLSRAAEQKIEKDNFLTSKFGSIHRKQAKIFKYLRAHKTKRQNDRADASVPDMDGDKSSPDNIVIKISLTEAPVASRLLDHFFLRGPPTLC